MHASSRPLRCQFNDAIVPEKLLDFRTDSVASAATTWSRSQASVDGVNETVGAAEINGAVSD
jgi:hypothetical protein